MKRIAIIPARGNSQRIPGKNIKPFSGEPIIGYSIKTAFRSGLFDNVVVSTDSAEISMVAKEYGAEVHYRNPELSVDEIGTQEVARNVLLDYADMYNDEFDRACVIYATSPLLHEEYLKLADHWLDCPETGFVMSVGTSPLQDAGCFYFGESALFTEGFNLLSPMTRMIPLPPERVCDVNLPEDWKRCEEMYEALNGGDNVD